MKKKVMLQIGLIVICFLLPTNVVIASSSEMDNHMLDQYHIDTLLDKGQSISPDWYIKPSSYYELVSWYLNLEKQYPNYIEVFKANEMYNTGKIAGGYDAYYVRITNESLGYTKPEVLFLGGPHGDESAGTIGLYWFTDWLMRKAFTDESCEDYSKGYLQYLIDNREIYIEICHNPYGFDEVIRYDYHGWDLNREADYDGPGDSANGIWSSIPGKTLYKFVNDHMIRVGCDFHAGVRMLLYPFSGTFPGINMVSAISGKLYENVPPDFRFFDASALRLGAYMGDFGGDLNPDNTGSSSTLLDYRVKGGIGEWAYAADVEQNPKQDLFVKDETYGNYPGSGILWLSPELSNIKNPPEFTFGNDTTDGYGKEVRRFVLHQTDLAQPYIRWVNNQKEDEIIVKTGGSFTLSWQVNGSLVVDHTFIQWGTNIDPIHNYSQTSEDHDTYAGKLLGGTGWDQADNGKTNGIIYQESIRFDTPGEYFLVAKAQVDQIYKQVIFPDVYGNNSYLRILKERTNNTYYEKINGLDGLEEIKGQTWWYSPVLKITVRGNVPPHKPILHGSILGEINKEYDLSIKSVDSDNDNVYYLIEWGDGTTTQWVGPYASNSTVSQTHTYKEKGNYVIKVKAKDRFNDESEYAMLPVQMPKIKSYHPLPFMNWLLEQISRVLTI